MSADQGGSIYLIKECNNYFSSKLKNMTFTRDTGHPNMTRKWTKTGTSYIYHHLNYITSLTSFNVIMIKSLIEIHRIHILLIMMFLLLLIISSFLKTFNSQNPYTPHNDVSSCEWFCCCVVRRFSHRTGIYEVSASGEHHWCALKASQSSSGRWNNSI